MNIDPKEKEKFNKIADEWWDPSGKFAPLHKINPLRANFISERTDLKNKKILDVACGGGLLAEALFSEGAKVSCQRRQKGTDSRKNAKLSNRNAGRAYVCIVSNAL